jgi:UDP-N-acetylmuramate--alanine ligase
MGARIIYDHKPDNIEVGVEEVVVSSAIKKDNSEYIEAVIRRLKIIPRAEKLAEVMKFEKGALCSRSPWQNDYNRYALLYFKRRKS